MVCAPILSALVTVLAVHETVRMLRVGLSDSRVMLHVFLKLRMLAQVVRIVDQRRVVVQLLADLGMLVEVVVEMLDVWMVLTVFGGRRGFVRVPALRKGRGGQCSGEQGRRDERDDAFHGAGFLLLSSTQRPPHSFIRGLACSLR